MKVALLIGFLLVGFAWCDENKLQDIGKKDSSSEEDLDSALETIQKYVDDKCKKQNGEVKNVKTMANQLMECLDDHVPNSAAKVKELAKRQDSSEEMCSDSGKVLKVRECFVDFTDLWKDCSDPEEKYVPDFFFDALEGVYSYICAEDGKNIKNMFSNSSLECFEVLAEVENLQDVCDEKLSTLKISEDDDVVTKADLCEGLTGAKTCYADYIKTKCTSDSNLREAFVGLMDAVSTGCTK